MNKKIVRWLGLIGSVCAGIASILSGDLVTGAGIISSGLASAEVLPGLR